MANATSRICCLVALAMFFFVGTANAQSIFADTYRVEFVGNIWNPSRQIVLSSGSTRCTRVQARISFLPAPCTDPDVTRTRFGGTATDFVQRFVLGRKAFGHFRGTLRLPRNQKLRLSVVPTAYEGTTTLSRFVDFEGQTFGIGFQTTTSVTWTAIRVGYEWDAITNDVGFVGIVVDLNHNAITADISAPTFSGIRSALYRRTINVPTLGAVGQVNWLKYGSLTGEFAVLRLDRWRSGTSMGDIDIYATANFTRNVGARLGYRSVRLRYAVTENPEESAITEDTGNVKMKGPYLGAVVRF